MEAIVPIVCDLVVRHKNIVGEDCAKGLVERFPRCLDAIQQALNVLLDSKAQSGMYRHQNQHEGVPLTVFQVFRPRKKRSG
jgi:hypothetical protein